MIIDWIGCVVDTGNLEEIDLRVEIAGAGHAVAVKSEVALSLFLVSVVLARLDLTTARSFVDGCEQRNPFSVELVLDVDRGLDITCVHELLDCTENFLLVDTEALHLGSHPTQLLVLLVKA